MSIIEHTTKLQLTLFKGSSINPAILEYYSADMQKIDDTFVGADNRLSALESASEDYASRLTSLETWKRDTVDPTLSNYETRISAIESVIETVSTANIDALTLRVDALEEKVEANSQHILTINGEITAINNSITALQTMDAEQNGRLDTLESKVSTLEDCCEEVRTTLTDHNNRINANAADIAALDVRVTANEGNIEANAQDIVILANQVRTNSEKINQILEDIPIQDILNAVTRIDALEELCGNDALETTAQTLTGAVNELLADNNDLSSSITILDGDMDAAQVAIQNLETLVGNTPLTTTAQRVTDAINELENEISTLSGIPATVTLLNQRVSTMETTVAGISTRMDGVDGRCTAIETKLGSATLDTTAQDVSGAVNELKSDVDTNTSNISTMNTTLGSAVDDINALETLETGSNATASDSGLLFSFTKRGNMCKVTIAGTLTSAISDGDILSNLVPNGYVSYGNVFTHPNARLDINNSLLSFELNGNDITVHSGAGTLAVGAAIYQTEVYMLVTN